MPRIAGAIEKTYSVRVRFRDLGSSKKRGGQLVISQAESAADAVALAQMLRRNKYKNIEFIFEWILVV